MEVTKLKKRIWSIVFAVISVMILCMLPERKTMAVDPAVKICGINLPKNNYMDINYQVGTDKPGNERYAYFDGSTLTLNDFDASVTESFYSAVEMSDVANIVIKGTNNISMTYKFGIGGD